MTLLHACQHYLRQAQHLLSRLDSTQYAMPHSHCFGASIGGHIRHCLDHYEQFLSGMQLGEVNYDARLRDKSIERDVAVALATIASLGLSLKDLDAKLDEHKDLMVRLDCGGDVPHWQRSSMGRELQFLVSHTVHHFAIIGIMCHALDVPLEPDFGLAPSTIKHQASA